MRFVADGALHLKRVPLDCLTAIYHRRSGQTHLLAEPLPELLDLLADGPRDASALLAALGLADAADARALLAAKLDELIDAGLIARA